MAQAQDIYLTAEDQAAWNEMTQLLEATPDTAHRNSKPRVHV